MAWGPRRQPPPSCITLFACCELYATCFAEFIVGLHDEKMYAHALFAVYDDLIKYHTIVCLFHRLGFVLMIFGAICMLST